MNALGGCFAIGKIFSMNNEVKSIGCYDRYLFVDRGAKLTIGNRISQTALICLVCGNNVKKLAGLRFMF
jgi:hypothetical protein